MQSFYYFKTKEPQIYQLKCAFHTALENSSLLHEMARFRKEEAIETKEVFIVQMHNLLTCVLQGYQICICCHKITGWNLK
jgi:hypothetical protein